MGPMNVHRFLAGLLWVAMSCGLAICLSQVHAQDAYWPNPWAVAAIGCLLTQVGLVAAWTIFGTQNIALRVGAIVLAQWFAGKLAAFGASGQTQSWALAFGVYAMGLVGLFWLLKALKITVTWASPAKEDQSTRESDSSPTATQSERQYSLFHMLSFITAASILFAFWTRPELPWQIALRACLFFGFLSLISAASFWSGLRQRLTFNVTLMVAGTFVAATWFSILDFAGLERASLIALALVLQLLMVTSAVTLRVFGMRLEAHVRH